MNSLVLIIIVSAMLASSSVHGQTYDYGIMIDAGSSGSRIYLYNWIHRNNNTLPIVAPYFINQTAVSLKVNPGLSSYANNVSAAGPSLAPLIAYVKANLNPNLWSITPIYLKATAGLRALPQSSQTAIIANVRAYLAQTPFEFQPQYAEVIPGTVEGELGWITTNFVFQILQQQNSSNSYGALDMGGASTQITFVPASPPAQYQTPLTLAGANYDLYAYSYPLGQDATLALILLALFQSQTSAPGFSGNIITNPCYLNGYNETYAANTSYIVVGTANYTACSDLILSVVIQKNASCSSCGLESIYQPPLYGQFVSFSGFAYTGQFYGINNTGNPSMFQSGAQSYCSLPWATAKQNNPSISSSLLKVYCFTGVYFYNILTVGYGFAPNTNISVLTTVGGIEISWTLGAMIYEASLLPFGPNNTTTTTTTTTGTLGSTTSSTTAATSSLTSSTATTAATSSSATTSSSSTAASSSSTTASTTLASSTSSASSSSTVASTATTSTATSTTLATVASSTTKTASTSTTTSASTSSTTTGSASHSSTTAISHASTTSNSLMCLAVAAVVVFTV